MGILGLVVFGLIVDVIAQARHAGPWSGWLRRHRAAGIAGGVLGGLVGRLAGLYGPGDAAGFIMSTLGAVALLLAYRKLRST